MPLDLGLSLQDLYNATSNVDNILGCFTGLKSSNQIAYHLVMKTKNNIIER